MPYVIHSEDSEMDFKEPLSPAPARIPSRMGSTHSLSTPPLPDPRGLSPSVPVTASFGLMGPAGVVVSIVTFLLDLASDVLLSFALWTQAENEKSYYRRQEERNWFAITLAIIIIPLIVINILSFIWYTKKKPILEEYCIFYRKSKFGKFTSVFLHLLLLGPLVRYFDTLRYGKRVRKYNVRIDMGSKGSVQRLTPKGEINAVLQLQVISRDTAMLDLMRSFFQDSPQLIFQIFLIYRSSALVTENDDNRNLILATQLVKIMIGLFVISWSLVSYQDELRRIVPGERRLTCGATNICLAWRACMVASRIVAIASFAALKVDGEGGLVKVYSDNAPMGAVLSFPSITALVLLGHWFLMVIWIHARRTTFCNTEEGGSRPLLEFLYSLAMSWVHVFCYVNLKETPSRRRMLFFYALVLVENTSFIVIWYMQLITKEVWLRVTVVFTVEATFVIGLSCAIGYYAFLQPKNYSRQTRASWRR